MNFQTLNKQRKFILIAAAAGIIAIFLPWVTVSTFLGSQTINGFHGGGVFVFLCFGLCVAMSLIGDQTASLNKINWLVTLIAGAVSLLVIILAFTQANDAMGGANKAADMMGGLMGEEGEKHKSSLFSGGTGIGLWLAMLAAAGVVSAAWFFKSAGMTIASATQGITMPSIPSINKAPNNNNKYAELERLLDLKTKGAITEEEYQEMKAKIL